MHTHDDGNRDHVEGYVGEWAQYTCIYVVSGYGWLRIVANFCFQLGSLMICVCESSMLEHDRARST